MNQAGEDTLSLPLIAPSETHTQALLPVRAYFAFMDNSYEPSQQTK
jgi:hypothetical protein